MPDDITAGEVLETSPAVSPTVSDAGATVNTEKTIEPEFRLENTIAQEPEKRGRGRPRKQRPDDRLNSVTHAPDPKPKPVAPTLIVNKEVNYSAMGEVAANVWFNVGEMVAGPDWAPVANETALISGAFKNYFQSAGIKDLPPGWVLGITLLTYSAARLTKPTVKDRFSGAILWLKTKIKR